MVKTLKKISFKKTLITMLIFSLFLSTTGYGTFAFAKEGKPEGEGFPENGEDKRVAITLGKTEGGSLSFEKTLKEPEIKEKAVKEKKIAEKDGYTLVSRKITDIEKDKEKDNDNKTFTEEPKPNEKSEFANGEVVLIKVIPNESYELKSITITNDESKDVNIEIKEKKKGDDEAYILRFNASENVKISTEFSKIKIESSSVDENNQKKEKKVTIEDLKELKSLSEEAKLEVNDEEPPLAMKSSGPVYLYIAKESLFAFDYAAFGTDFLRDPGLQRGCRIFGNGASKFTRRGIGDFSIYCHNPLKKSPKFGTHPFYPTVLSASQNAKMGAGLHYLRTQASFGSSFEQGLSENFFVWVFLDGVPTMGSTPTYQGVTWELSDSRALSALNKAREAITWARNNYNMFEGESYWWWDGDKGGLNELGSQPAIAIKYNWAGGYLGIHKTSSLPNITDGNRCYSLSGAEYGIYKSRSLSGDSRVGTLVTDSNGRAISERLPFGTYYVAEIKASKGYEIDKTVYPIIVDSSRTTPASANVAAVKEVPGNDPSILEITKLWSGDKTPTIPSLEGTQFTIRYYDGFYNENNLPGKATRTWVVESKKVGNKFIAMLTDKYLINKLSDSLYKDDRNQSVIPYGTISIQETKPAFGYTLEGTLRDTHGKMVSTTKPYVTQITKENGVVRLKGGNKYSGRNVPIFGSIKIKKVKDDEKSPIEGAKFELKNSKGQVVKVSDTNSRGEIVFDKLYPDRYTVTELKSAEGYTLLKEPIVIDVPTKLTKAEIDSKGYVIGEFKYNERDNMYYKHDVSIDVINNKPFPVPTTGENPNNYLAIFGGFLIAGGIATAERYRRKDSLKIK